MVFEFVPNGASNWEIKYMQTFHVLHATNTHKKLNYNLENNFMLLQTMT